MKEYVCIPKDDYDELCGLIDALECKLRDIRSTKNERGKLTVIKLDDE